MPFDPAKPAASSPLDSAEMRGQLTALKDLIDAQEARIAALETALAGTALNPPLGDLSLSLTDPPTSQEVQEIISGLNFLRNQLHR